MVAEAARQELRIFYEQADPEAVMLSKMSTFFVAGSDAIDIDEVHDGDFDDCELDLNVFETTTGADVAVTNRGI